MWMWLVAAAWAGAPEAHMVSDDTVVGTVSVAMSADALRAKLADPVWVTSVDGGETTVAVRSRDGACLVADYVSPNAIAKVNYTVRQCPTAKGHVSELVEANLFSAYRTEWTVVPEGQGSLLTYTITMRTTLFLPTSFITRTLRKSVEKMLGSFAELGAPAASASSTPG